MERIVLYLNRFLKNSRFKKRKGFSIIELLVSVGILGTLVAIAIPSYNGYRRDTAWTVLDSDGTSIQRAFLSCMAIKPFSSCDSLAELGVDVGYNATSTASAPNFCVSLEREAGGYKFKGCYSINAKDGSTLNRFNFAACYIDGADNRGRTTNCVANDGKYQANCDRRVKPTVYCSSNQDCIDAGAGSVCSSSGGKWIPTGNCDSDASCEFSS